MVDCRGELLVARQEAAFLLHTLHFLPSGFLPELAAQPHDKRPVAGIALAQVRSPGADRQKRLALALLWPDHIAVTALSEAKVRNAAAHDGHACHFHI